MVRWRLHAVGGASLALTAGILLVACSQPLSGADTAAGTTGSAGVTPSAAPSSARGSTNVSPDERRWAAQALQILDTVNSGVSQFHDSTAAPAGSARAQSLRQQAYATLAQALSAYQQTLPETQALQDSSVRDQFIFVMGNISGFLNPTPDLPGDPPTLGDRIGRSLQNAISSSATLRPKLQQLAAQG